MATHDYVIANGTGASVRSDLNNALAAIVSNNSSSSEPSTRYAYQWWADTTTGQLKLRNAANNGWVTIFELDGTMLMEDGTVSAPGLAFASDLNTGFFSGGADKLNFATGGVERLEIGSSEVVFNDASNDVDFRVESNGQTHMLFVDGGNDRVGIGTASPSQILELKAATPRLCLNGTTGNSFKGIEFDHNGTTYGSITHNQGNGDLTISSGDTGSGYFINFKTDNTERLRILSDGTIATAGLTATPGTVAAGSYIQHAANAGFFGNNGDAKFGSSANNPVLFQVNGSEKARLDTSGRLLVGTSSGSGEPIAAFQGRSTDASDGAMIALTKAGATPSGTIGIIQFATGSNYVKHYATIISASDGTVSSSSTPGMLRFNTTAAGATSASERMRINNLGKMGIMAQADSDALAISSGQSSGTSYEYMRGMYGSTTAYAGTLSFRVFTNGNVENTNNSYSSISDIKLKENIVDASSQWADIKELRVRNYNFIKGQTHTQIGLVAQEVELVSPGLVSESPDRDEDDNDLGTVTKSVNYSVLYMKAVKALQEAMTRIETLETKFAALEAG
tara:strand:+ start:1080 stop:2774 length:1695 start_codon:yes stop_codon:yes gene_type:complete